MSLAQTFPSQRSLRPKVNFPVIELGASMVV